MYKRSSPENTGKDNQCHFNWFILWSITEFCNFVSESLHLGNLLALKIIFKIVVVYISTNLFVYTEEFNYDSNNNDYDLNI